MSKDRLMYKLSTQQILHFIEKGFVVANRVFPPALATQITPIVWSRLGMDQHDSKSWVQPHVILKEVLNDDPIPQVFTALYRTVVHQLCGQDRSKLFRDLGHWPISLPVFNNVPWEPFADQWHLDTVVEQKCLDSPDVGLSALHFLTEVMPGGGGVTIREGSHHRVSRILAAVGPEGIDVQELNVRAVESTGDLPITEITGRAGDVLFMNPHTVHGGSKNTRDVARVMAHKIVGLTEPMNFDRQAEDEHSPVELAIRQALSTCRT